MNETLKQVQYFFPQGNYSSDNFAEMVELDTLDISKESHSNSLKGALFDETVLEVQLHNVDTIYFCRVLDNPFDEIFAEEDGTNIYKKPDYEEGSYLDKHEHLFLTPLEPSEGNYLISAAQKSDSKVILRIISAGTAIEMGCFFQSRTMIGDLPSLKLSFPLVAQKLDKAREFRAKVPKSMKVVVTIERNKKKTITTTPLNISLNGMSLIDPMGRKSNIQVKEKVWCTIQSPKEDPIIMEASVMHKTNLRNVSGVQYCFGLQFHYHNTTVQSAVEKLIGLVQRKHLRELSEIEQKFGVYYEK